MSAKKSNSNPKPSARVKVAIAVLSVLLVLSSCALAWRLVYLGTLEHTAQTAIVPDNLIGSTTSSCVSGTSSKPEQSSYSCSAASSKSELSSQSAQTDTRKAATLELHSGKPDDNKPFEVSNMLPGDKITQYYRVRVHHSGSVQLNIIATVTEQTRSLANVLCIKITHLDTGRVLYDGTFSQLNPNGYPLELQNNTQGITDTYYQIDAYLPASTGNEHQSAKLKADLLWRVKDTQSLTSPETGEDSAALWYVLLVCSSGLLALLLVTRRRKERDCGRA